MRPSDRPSTSPPPEAGVVGGRSGALRRVMVRPEAGAILGTILLWLIFASLGADNGFITVAGTAGMLEVAAQVGIVGTAVALLMIAGQFDLSVGSTVGATGMVLALALSELHLDVWVAVALALVLGIIIGVVNGVLVVKTGLPSFIVTLASFFVLRGATIALTRLFTGLTVVGGLDEFTAGDPSRSSSPRGSETSASPSPGGWCWCWSQASCCIGAAWGTGSTPPVARPRARGWSACRPAGSW